MFQLCAAPRHDHSGWPLGSSGRVEVVHYALSFLVSMAFTCEEQAQPAICNSDNYSGWLRRLVLETPEVVHKLLHKLLHCY